jgi:Fic family protein
MNDYKHLSFRRTWDLSIDCSHMLGECEAYVEALTDIPLKPKDRSKLHLVSLIKGAQATTAIEGNTLTEEEIAKLQDGWTLPPSKEYLQTEVNNILTAFDQILLEVTEEKKEYLVTPELIKRFHLMVGKELGEHFDAIPGRFRDDRRVVGRYLAPDHREVSKLIDQLCVWSRKEFHFEKGQNFSSAVIQAIVTHVYIEWIHPFGDGNGRTGRLLEFYILLRAGLPSIASHILSNFYNQTRQEYYRQFDNARIKRDLTEFISYAVKGFRDGLKDTLKVIQKGQFVIFWHNFIYETFSEMQYTKIAAFKRKRELMLEMPIDKEIDIDEVFLLTPKIAQNYAKLQRSTVMRDLKELQEVKLLVKKGRKYRANVQMLKVMMPGKK